MDTYHPTCEGKVVAVEEEAEAVQVKPSSNSQLATQYLFLVAFERDIAMLPSLTVPTPPRRW